jgi:hypothetical protein
MPVLLGPLTSSSFPSIPSDFYLIGSAEISSPANSITISNIPNDYRVLEIRAVFGTVSAQDVFIRFNGDSQNRYDTYRFYTTGATQTGSAFSDKYSGTYGTAGYSGATGTMSEFVGHIVDYQSSSKAKTAKFWGSSEALGYLQMVGWRSLDPITSITFFANNNINFLANTRFSLYGMVGS